MIAFPPGTKIYLASKPVDMRKGFDGLAAMAKQVFNHDPYSGHAFLFRAKRADYLKMLYWDGSGLCLFAKKLEGARFVWPPLLNGAQLLSPAQVATLIEGMDWRRTVIPAMPKTPQCLSMNNL